MGFANTVNDCRNGSFGTMAPNFIFYAKVAAALAWPHINRTYAGLAHSTWLTFGGDPSAINAEI